MITVYLKDGRMVELVNGVKVDRTSAAAGACQAETLTVLGVS